MALRFHEKVGMVVLSVAAPHRLARIMLRPYPQPMAELLETAGEVARIEFPTTGGLRLRGWWVTPPGGRVSRDHCVVLAHGWTGHALRMKHFVEPLLALGYPVMLYNARSHGDSDYFPVCSLVQFTEDVRAAVAYARSRVGHVAMLGHSLGAAGTLVAAADGAPVDAVMVLAPPAHPAAASMDILRTEGVPAERIFRRIRTHVESAIGRRFDEIAPELRIREVRCPVLLVHGTADEVVPFAHCERIRQQAGPNVEICVVPGADHDQVKTDPLTLERVSDFLQRAMPWEAC